MRVKYTRGAAAGQHFLISNFGWPLYHHGLISLAVHPPTNVDPFLMGEGINTHTITLHAAREFLGVGGTQSSRSEAN